MNSIVSDKPDDREEWSDDDLVDDATWPGSATTAGDMTIVTPPEPELEVADGEDRARGRPEREDLEARLAALMVDVRAQSEEELRKKRAETVLSAQLYVAEVAPPAHAAPTEEVGTKVVLARGLDPQNDPTLVGRRTDGATWEFGVDEDGPPTVREGSGSEESTKSETSPAPTPRRHGGRVAAFVGAALSLALGLSYLAGGKAPPLRVAVAYLTAPAVRDAEPPQPAASISAEASGTGDPDPEVMALWEQVRAEQSKAVSSSRANPKALPRGWRRTLPSKQGSSGSAHRNGPEPLGEVDY